jgi:hypothetical protein
MHHASEPRKPKIIADLGCPIRQLTAAPYVVAFKNFEMQAD